MVKKNKKKAKGEPCTVQAKRLRLRSPAAIIRSKIVFDLSLLVGTISSQFTILEDNTWDCAWWYTVQRCTALIHGRMPGRNPIGIVWQHEFLKEETIAPLAQSQLFGVVWAVNPDLDLAATDWG